VRQSVLVLQPPTAEAQKPSAPHTSAGEKVVPGMAPENKLQSWSLAQGMAQFPGVVAVTWRQTARASASCTLHV
jgi:hypothetical protein